MRAAIFHGPGDVRVETVPDPSILAEGDAVVRVTYACICGSDLWFYRGQGVSWKPGHRTGHEFVGVVEEVGSGVRGLTPGDAVVAPFSFGDGSCEFCARGLWTSCVQGGFWGQANDGGQGEAVRVPFADANLVRLPPDVAGDSEAMRRVVPLTDVLPTGHHGCVLAEVGPGRSVAVIGDGAVGLCAVLAARRLGAERVIVLGHHDARLDIARRFGADDVVTARGDEAVAAVRELTGGGAHSVVECVGTQASMDQALAVARPGGSIGLVGVPHTDGRLAVNRLFGHNIALRFGVAPVRAYIPDLLVDVLAGRLDPSSVLDHELDLEGVPEGYAAMDSRRALKVLIVAS